jgi:macrolide transport system ATP-binding/permease protein
MRQELRLNSFFRKLRWLTRRPDKEAELREELQFHLEEEAQQRQGAGLGDREARWAARRELGNLTAVQESTRAVWGWTILEQLFQDLRYALRTMFRNRSFTALAVLSLALGIGANTAIYSFMDSILLRALPVADPESLALLNWHSKEPRGIRPNHVMHSMDGSTWADGKSGMTSGIFPFGVFELFQKNETIFSSLFAYCKSGKRNLTIKGQAEIDTGEYVSGDYFRGLGVPPAAGRMILADDDRAGAPLVVVISMRLSQRRFSGAANAVGQPILIDNLPFTVVGVTPPEFFGVDPAANADFYVPMHTNLVLDRSVSWAATPETYLNRNYYWVEMMGRLRPGVSLAQAQAALAPPFHQWVAATAANDRERESLPALTVKEGASGLGTLRRRYSKPLYVLLTMVGLILAIACANTANLLLSRAAARRREMAVRLSIGAGRLRVVRQLLTESIFLAFVGGILGVLLALWGVRFLTFLLANGQENFTLRAELNWHVLSATFALSVLCGAVFGLAPAIQSTRTDVMPALKGSRATEPRARARAFRRVSLSQALVVSQIVFSLLMLVAAGLFVRTLSNLQSIQMGFSRENVLLFELNARQAGHGDPEILAFYDELRTRFAAIPGVRGATLSHASLLGAGRGLDIRVSGTPAPDTRILNTGPGFFSTMQIPMLRGREIDERDQPGSPPVVVANERFTRIHFGSENPLGRRVTLGGLHPRDMEIVGVSANAHYGELKDDIQPVLYIPYNQGDYPRMQQMVYALRTAGDPLAYVKTVREIVHQADSRIPVMNVLTQAAEIDRNMNQEIVFARLCMGFAILALVIASIGLYGTMAYAVARRTGEIGIRMALGAQRGVIVRMILRQVLVVATVGFAIGLPTALGASRLVESFLFGVKANDPLALASAVAILLGAVVLAGYVPARKASRIDPMIAVRHE